MVIRLFHFEFKMHFGRDSEGANEFEMPAIVKINQLLNQISTNLAKTLYDTSQAKDKGTFPKYDTSKKCPYNI